MKRILVTGANGFVARHVLSALASAEAADLILGIGREISGALPSGVSYRKTDICDAAAVEAVVTEFGPTHILHLAAMASVQQAASEPAATWRVNVGGLLNLAEATARSSNSVTFVFVSSGEVYGRAFLTGHPISEAIEPEPLGSYARSKRIGEEILQDMLPKAGARLIILRPFHHIGPQQDERFVVPSFAAQIARIEAGLLPAVLEVGNLAAQRDFLPVGDVVRAYMSVIACSDSIDSGTIFNICSGRPRSVESVLSDLRRHATTTFAVKAVAERMRPSEIPVSVGDSTRLSAAIGWTPMDDWDVTIQRVLADARAKVRRETP